MTEEFERDVQAQLAKLCEITERESWRVLEELIQQAHLSIEYGPDAKEEIADLALEYARRRHELDKYRALLRPVPPAISVVK